MPTALLTPTDLISVLGLAALLLLLTSLPAAFWGLMAGDHSQRLSSALVAGANLFLAALLLRRWIDTGHFPVSNLYESLCFLSWCASFAQLLLMRMSPHAWVPALTTPLALGALAFASFALPSSLQTASSLVPALRSSWLVMHVSVIMASYGALLVGSALAVGVLLVNRDQAVAVRGSSIGSGGFRAPTMAAGKNFTSLTSETFSQAERLDNLSYRTITVGFLLLSIGIISGAVWANEAWGSWWSWDPKETWALICWLVYAAYLHTRLNRSWHGRRSALLATSGLVVVAICYIGVNLLGVGLHSYGWFLGS
ncbi:MAG: cytochrome C biogenesis protein [Candidatus Synechococcus spongiarum SP3]|uniref:Cytochrome c biogenesis protein CcsA n=1 Tax=Candidatus Synechococcus spongiarum SP3 TaxID=1604020 RepID=A0A0G2J526_9SYNE|nr:MAG: cytochrome C biogenesis protein [Candidatus Synechococcus spongiarum SP3]